MAGLVGCPTFVLIIWPESGQIPSWLSGGGILHLSSYRGAAHIGNENGGLRLHLIFILLFFLFFFSQYNIFLYNVGTRSALGV